MTIFFTCTTLQRWSEEPDTLPPSLAAGQKYGTFVKHFTLGSLLFTMGGLITSSHMLNGLISDACLEVGIMVVILCCGCVNILAASPFLLVKMLGTSPDAVWGPTMYFSDSRSLLVFHGFVAGTHIVLPIRWHMLLLLDGVSLALFGSFMFGVGGPEGDSSAINFFMLMGLVALVSLGHRGHELTERMVFVAFVKEKTLRFEMEFHLEQQSRRDAEDETIIQRDGGSEDASLPMTTDTGKLFTTFGMCDTSASEKLAGIRDVAMREHWLIDPNEIDVLTEKVLGEGAFGVVYRGIYCGAPVAVKLSRASLTGENMRHFQQLANEIRILRQGRHPNIVFFYGTILDTESRLGMVVEQVDGPALCTFVSHECAKEPRTQHAISVGIASALMFLHSRKTCVVHGDLKSTNVLIAKHDSCVQAKLLDFGLARMLTRCARPLGGSLLWVAPEVFRCDVRQRPKASADIFSFGRVMYLVVTRRKPLEDMDVQTLAECLNEARFPPLKWPKTSALEDYAKDIVDPEVFRGDARQRIKASADIFSFGRVIYLVVTRMKPLDDMDMQTLSECLHEARFPPLLWPKTSALEDYAKDLVDKCLNVQESLRPSSKDVYEAIIAWPVNSSKADAEGVRDRWHDPSLPSIV
eukprot:CAMPEP_0117601172 /NCGR_PEP_ID=MMETSP0784-20121206/76885_1 /TAXON_ID=39447 /ORGANISM="" /LENGTH=636 /DNA_ID=CAMNT_0005403865 /DNA_START=168 /DNA_END=2075 /DNA_ORIENTATION=-